MKMTIKCPNCNQEIDHNSSFCDYCGVSICIEADHGESEHMYPSPELHGAAMCCPEGHPITNPSLGFCPVCGSVLASNLDMAPGDPAPEEPVYIAPKSRHLFPRTCVNGHTYDDPELSFCPECGYAYDKSPAVTAGWTCHCGQVNGSDSSFCEGCGQPQGTTISPRRKRSESHIEKPVIRIPNGLVPPTSEDLKPKG